MTESGDFLMLRIWAEMYEDAQKARIACANRARQGVDAEQYQPQLDAMAAAENEMGKALRRCYRRVVPASVIEWQQSTRGIGEHLLARLLGALGHPRIATPHHWEGEGTDRVLVADPPFERSVSQLWSYCGHGDPNRKRRKGMTADEAMGLGNPRCKMLVHLLAEATMKARSPEYRPIYDDTKDRYLQAGWTKGHAHNAALRKVGKEILRDLWIAAGAS